MMMYRQFIITGMSNKAGCVNMAYALYELKYELKAEVLYKDEQTI